FRQFRPAAKRPARDRDNSHDGLPPLALIEFTFFPNPKQNPFTANVNFPWRPPSVRDNIIVVRLQPWTIPKRKFYRARTTNPIQAFIPTPTAAKRPTHYLGPPPTYVSARR